MAMIYVLIFLLLLFVASCNHLLGERIVVLLTSVAGLFEAGLVLLQIISPERRTNPLFLFSGTFKNPGPLGGFLACCAVFLISYYLLSDDDKKWIKGAALVSGLSCLVLVPASFSRTAWVSVAVAGFFFMRRNRFFFVSMLRGLLFGAAFLLLCLGAYILKPESAKGRLFMWKIESLAVLHGPTWGAGKGSALGVYGMEQAGYFAKTERSADEIAVAGCPDYVFNEYLKIGIENGLPVMVLCIAAILTLLFVCYRRNHPSAYGLISMSIFAFASYPFSRPEFIVLTAAMLAIVPFSSSGSICTKAMLGTALLISSGFAVGKCERILEHKSAERSYESARTLVHWERYEEAVVNLAPLYHALAKDYRFLYDYGYSLYKIGEYDKGIEILSEGSRISSDPMFHNIIGRCYEARKEYDEAEEQYILAHNMVPCRLYPLMLLADMYRSIGDIEKSCMCYETVLSLPVNPKNRNMINLHNDAENCYYRLKSPYV